MNSTSLNSAEQQEPKDHGMLLALLAFSTPHILLINILKSVLAYLLLVNSLYNNSACSMTDRNHLTNSTVIYWYYFVGVDLVKFQSSCLSTSQCFFVFFSLF